MFYLVYKTTNLVNGKFYIGAHKTENKYDNYIGSGKLLKKAIEKYGIENFTKEILVECSSEEEMFNYERTLVELCEQSYNLKFGGEGGWDHVHRDKDWKSPFTDVTLQKQLSKRGVSKLSELRKNAEWYDAVKKKISASMKGKQLFLGKSHSQETKDKIGVANSKQTGKNNSQYGTKWITNEIISKKINKEDPIPEGWRLGRVLKSAGIPLGYEPRER